MALQAKSSKNILPPTQQELAQAAQYLAKSTGLPSGIRDTLFYGLLLASQQHTKTGTDKTTQVPLARALGVIPSSERQANAKPSKGIDEPHRAKRRIKTLRERLEQQIADGDRIADYHSKHVKKNKKKSKKARQRLAKLQQSQQVAPPTGSDPDSGLPDLSAKEEAERQQEFQAFLQRSRLGDGLNPELASVCENLISSGLAKSQPQEISCDVDRDSLKKGAIVKQSFYEVRQRVDFSICIDVLQVRVEKASVVINGETTLVTGDAQEIGPPGYKVTWGFLSNMTLLLAEYAMPMHRFARLVSTDSQRYTSAQISRYFSFVANFFVPIYLYLAQQLADAPILTGDDTPSLVLEVRDALARQDMLDASSKNLPWDTFATAAKAKSDVAQNGNKASLSARLAAQLGFVSARKDKKGNKTSFNTTVLSGRSNGADPKSTIILYRSHLGSLGNLLDAVLQNRNPDNKQLVLQTDLSTTNLIEDKSWLSRFDVRLAGCSSHARRPFAIYRQQSPDLCDALLSFFGCLAAYENCVDNRGRNYENTLAVRNVDCRALWEDIREHCEYLQQDWPSKTNLGDGARYVLKNFDKLTYYLDDARLAASNNYSERMLRQEKLIRNNSLFRKSLTGRFSLDILRTIIQTAQAAGANPVAYLQWVMKMPQEAVASSPEAFTPAMFVAWQAETASVETLSSGHSEADIRP